MNPMECMYQVLRELVTAFLRAMGNAIRSGVDTDRCNLDSDMVSMQRNDD